MSKFKLMMLSLALFAPVFVAAGYKWGEYKTAQACIQHSANEQAIYTKLFTQLGVLLHDDETELLSEKLSALAYASHRSMVDSFSFFGVALDPEADEYFNSNKSKLVSPAP